MDCSKRPHYVEIGLGQFLLQGAQDLDVVSLALLS